MMTDTNAPSLFSRVRSMAAACARDLGALAGMVGATVGIGALACAACCALPLVGALGFGGVAGGAALAGLDLSLIGGAMALVSLLVPVVLWARSRTARAAPTGAAMCPADGSCGCAARKAAEPLGG